MRLIDADAFYKDLCDSLNEMTRIGIVVDGEWLWGKLNDSLENAPTIEPERPKGKWVDSWRSKMDGTRYWYRECDHCGYERNDCDPEKDSNFCPHCGAEMLQNGGRYELFSL